MGTNYQPGEFYQAWTLKREDGSEAYYIRVGKPHPAEFGVPLVWTGRKFVEFANLAHAEYMARIMDENARFRRIGADLARHLWARLPEGDRTAAWEAIQAFNDLTTEGGADYAAGACPYNQHPPQK
jgi:hypothetical protein